MDPLPKALPRHKLALGGYVGVEATNPDASEDGELGPIDENYSASGQEAAGQEATGASSLHAISPVSSDSDSVRQTG